MTGSRPVRRRTCRAVGSGGVPEQPAQRPPPVQRLRLRYAKRGRMRFTSHRDFGRALERAVARARVPVAYSSGFTPHPRISYPNAAPTGAESEAEYVEIAVTEEVDPQQVRSRLDESLSAGLDIVDVVVAGPGSLADRLEAGRWRIRLTGVPQDQAERAVQQFLDRTSVEVERRTKKGVRRFDCRAAVLALAVSAGGPGTGNRENPPPCAILDVVVRQETPTVRPDDILAGLREVAGLRAPEPPLVARLAQGPWDSQTGCVGDPLAPDRDAGPTGSATAEQPGRSTPA